MSFDVSHDKELTIPDLLDIFLRRRWILAGVFSTFVIAALLACVLTTRRYEAMGTIQLEKESSGGLDPGSLMGNSSSSTDALNTDINIQTQAGVLRSSTLALRTIRNLKLDNTRDFQLPESPFYQKVQLILRMDANPNAKSSAQDSPARRARVLKQFQGHLTVNPLPGTRLIQISYSDPDPVLAASVVNELVQQLIDYIFETRYRATELASGELSRQLADLRTHSEQLQAQVAQMQQDSGLYNTGTTDTQGRQQAYSSVLDKFQRSAAALNDASQNVILKEAIFQAVKSGNAELISSLAGNSTGGVGQAGILNSLGTVQSLRTQEAALQSQLDQVKVKFGPNYPPRAELQGSIDSLEKAIQDEISRIKKRAENDYNVANQIWESARHNYQELKAEADAQNNKAIKYMMTRQEADESRALYEDLLKRLKEAGILQGLKSNTIAVVDPAAAPAELSKPNVPLYLLGGVSLGMLLGGLVALVTDVFDDRFHDIASIEALGIPVVGILPRRSSPRMSDRTSPGSRYRDAMGAIRLALTTSRNVVKTRVVVVTSAVPGDTSGTFCMDLAASFASKGKSVLLIEADMKRPTLLKELGLSHGSGLSLLLAGDPIKDAITVDSSIPHLSLLPAGPVPLFPSELLESGRMRTLLSELLERYDLIFIDSPPVLALADTLVLSEMADITIQVAELCETSRTSLKRAHDVLSAHSRARVGVVVTNVPEHSAAYRSYYGYNRFQKNRKDEINEAA